MQENNEEKELQFNQEADSIEQIIKDFFGLSLLSSKAFTIKAEQFSDNIKNVKVECDCSTCRKRKENIQLLERCYQMEFKENA